MVLVHGACIAHGGGDTDLGALEGVGAHARHAGAVGHDLGGVLLVLGVLDELLMFAGTALADAAEGEDGDGEEHDATHHTADDVFGLGAEAVPFLLDALHARRAVRAVKFDGVRGAVEIGLVGRSQGRVQVEDLEKVKNTYLTTLMLCQLPVLSPH